MKESDITLVRFQEERTVWGIWGRFRDRTVARDTARVSAEYRRISGTPKDGVPFFLVCRGYDPAAGEGELFAGGEAEASGLAPLALPAGDYGVVRVRPRLGLLWGPAIGEAKRYFYTRWLPGSGRRARNLEYEHHTGESLGKSPSIRLCFALEDEAGEDPDRSSTGGSP